MSEDRIVNGYFFQSAEDAELARQELKKVEYIEARVDYKNPTMVLKLYERAVNERIFKTPVGYEFLKRLYDYLKQALPATDVLPVPMQQGFSFRMRESYSAPQKRVASESTKKSRYVVSVILNIILAASVILMFVIASTGNNPNILNYERALTNKYASWEQELSQREKAVKEKEREWMINQDTEQ